VLEDMGKMFALTDVESFVSVNLKCDPEIALDLREQFHAVQPGCHMSKKHWDTVTINGDATDEKIYEWTNDSYNLVVKSLTKKLQAEIEDM